MTEKNCCIRERKSRNSNFFIRKESNRHQLKTCLTKESSRSKSIMDTEEKSHVCHLNIKKELNCDDCNIHHNEKKVKKNKKKESFILIIISRKHW